MKKRTRITPADVDAPETDEVDETLPSAATVARTRPPPDDELEGRFPGWEEEDKIREILANELNEGAQLEIHRKNSSGDWAYLDTFALDEWGTQKKAEIARTYGGGEYQGVVRRMAEGLRGTFGPKFKFNIDRALRPKPPEQQDETHRLAELAARSTEGSGMNMMQMMQLQQQQTNLMMQMQQKSMETMVSVITAALTRPPPPAPPGPSDTLVTMLAQQAFRDRPQLDPEKIIGMVAKLKNIAGNREADDDDDDGKPDLIEKLLSVVPDVLKILGQVQLQPQSQQPRPALSPARQPPEQPTPPEPSTEDTGQAMPMPNERPEVQETRAALEQFLPQLVALCDGGNTPEQVADMIAEHMDDDQQRALAVLLERDDWLAILGDVHEPVLARSPFFSQLRELILNGVDEVDTENNGAHPEG